MKAILCFFLTVFSCCRVGAGGGRSCVRCSDLALPCPLSLPGWPLQVKAMVPWWSRSLPPSLAASPQTRKKPTLAPSEAVIFAAFAPDPNLLCFWEITAVPGEWWCEDVSECPEPSSGQGGWPLGRRQETWLPFLGGLEIPGVTLGKPANPPQSHFDSLCLWNKPLPTPDPSSPWNNRKTKT